MIDHPCPTGHICREPRDGSGCGAIFDEGPDGAWWWTCPNCGGVVHPRTQAEADEQPSLWGADTPGERCPTCGKVVDWFTADFDSGRFEADCGDEWHLHGAELVPQEEGT